MGALILELSMQEFKKILFSNFMIEGVRSMLAFRVDYNEIAVVSGESGFTIIVFVKEMPECVGSDFYAVSFDDRVGNVSVECFKGEPSINTLRFKQILYVVNPDKILIGFEEAKSILNTEGYKDIRVG